MLKHVNFMAALLVTSLLAQGFASADDKNEKPNVVQEQQKPGLSIVETAATLVMRAEKEKSPLLLLAAADLLDTATESKREISDVKSKTEGGDGKKSEKSAPAFSREALQARALELAANDADKKLVQAWIARPTSRGLVARQGNDLESVKLRGETHKVLHRGVIGSGGTFTLSNVIFEAKRPARIVVIGDGDGDLDLWVYDGNSGGLIDSDTDGTSTCVAEWRPRYEGPFRIRIKNVGAIAERYVVLANW